MGLNLINKEYNMATIEKNLKLTLKSLINCKPAKILADTAIKPSTANAVAAEIKVSAQNQENSQEESDLPQPTYFVKCLTISKNNGDFFIEQDGELIRLAQNDIIEVGEQFYQVNLEKEYIAHTIEHSSEDSILDADNDWNIKPIPISHCKENNVITNLKKHLWSDKEEISKFEDLSFLYGAENKSTIEKHTVFQQQTNTIHSHFTKSKSLIDQGLIVVHDLEMPASTVSTINKSGSNRKLLHNKGNILHDLGLSALTESMLIQGADGRTANFQDQAPIDILDELIINSANNLEVKIT